jgi:hypothetical protein
MKHAQRTRNVRWFVLLALAASSPANAQNIIGPGTIPTPLELVFGSHRVVPGTEIISHQIGLIDGGMHLGGGHAILTRSINLVFDGGHVEGATVTTTTPGVKSASAGIGIALQSPSTVNFTFNDGVFRGGSVIINAPEPPDPFYTPQSAIATGMQVSGRITINGGLFEGGTISHGSPQAGDPRAPALRLRGRTGVTADVFGGQFVGGIEIHGPSDAGGRENRLVIHGSEFDMQPPPVNGLIRFPYTSTVTGKYLSGTPFSIKVIASEDNRMVTIAGDTLTVEMQVPEPAAGALSVLICLVGAVRPRRRIPDGLVA